MSDLTELVAQCENHQFATHPSSAEPVEKSLLEQWHLAREQARKLLKAFDETDHPRDEHGRWTDSSSDGVTIPLPPSPPHLDRDGKPLVDLDGNKVWANVNGDLKLYRRVDDATAEQIRETGKFPGTGEIHFTTHETGYADGVGDSLVEMRVPPKLVRMTEARHDGEVVVAVEQDKLRSHMISKVLGSEVIAYHGSTAEVAKAIAADGLKVRRGKTYAKDTNTDGESHYLGERGQSVYITNDRDEALRFAAGRAYKLKEQKKRQPDVVVFKMQMPRAEWDKLQSDEEHEHAKRAPYIPPKYFSEYRIYHDKARWDEDIDPEQFDVDSFELAKIVKLRAMADNVTLFMSFIVLDDAAQPSKSLQDEWFLARGRAQTWLKEFDESKHPRVPAGSPDGGQFGEGGTGGGEGAASKPKGKGKTKREDFAKANIRLNMLDSNVEPFIDKWNEAVGEDPAEFKKDFMGGLDGTMAIGGSGCKIEINGQIKGTGANEGQMVGNFTRAIDLDSKTARSDYFKLEKTAQKADIGKKMLAGNVKTYQDLGIEKVTVYANISVGGYAWAKYGYVPEAAAVWPALRARLEKKLTGEDRSTPRGANTVEADDWGMLSSDVQDDVRDRWMRDTYLEFLSSEEQNWHDSGGSKEEAKRVLADEFTNNRVTTADIPEWINESLDETRLAFEESGHPIPYTNRQIYDAMDLAYDGGNGDGEDDPLISFDSEGLKEPIGYDPTQDTLPGIEPLDPSSYLTKQMREELTSGMTDAFNKKAEENAGTMDPPSYLADSVREYQDEHWDSMSERDRLEQAIRFDMANIEIEPDDDEEQQLDLQPPTPGEDPLLAAVRSSDPKSIWKIADSPRGKELLLGESWNGVLDLKDKDSMDRFNKYVGNA